MNREEENRLIQDHMDVHRIGEYPHIRLAEELDMATYALRAQREQEADKHPCAGCDCGRGSANSKGIIKSCHDTCEKMTAYLAKREPIPSAQAVTGDGLKVKYIVRKADTGESVYGCFVLRPDRDPAAVAALRAYAAATDNNELASDIINWVGAERSKPMPEPLEGENKNENHH